MPAYPFEPWPDVEMDEGHLIFTGNPYTLTREHPEYILRYFRYWGQFGAAPPDPVILLAFAANASLLLETKHARIYSEMRELLSLPRPKPALELMFEQQLVKYALGFLMTDFSLLEPLERIDVLRGEPSAWYIRLLLVLLRAPMPPEKALMHLVAYWEIEKEDAKRFVLLLEYFAAIDPAMATAEKEALTEKFSPLVVKNLLLLRWALEDDIDASKDAYLAALASFKE